MGKGGESQAARIHNNQVIWLKLKPGHREIEIFDKPFGNDKAIIAALTVLEAGTLKSGGLREAILLYLVIRDAGHLPLSRLKEVLSDACAKDPSLQHAGSEDILDAVFKGSALAYVEELLRYFRPSYDCLAREDQAALIEAACDRINKFHSATEELIRFLEYGAPRKKLKPGIKDVRRDIQAAILRRVENMSPQEIGIVLGARPPGLYDEIKKDHSTVRDWITRGEDVLKIAWGVEGWSERAQKMKAARERYQHLSEEERIIEDAAENLALYGGLPIGRARQLLRQDDPGEDLDETQLVMWHTCRLLLDNLSR
jgi:hypothetical protein